MRVVMAAVVFAFRSSTRIAKSPAFCTGFGQSTPRALGESPPRRWHRTCSPAAWHPARKAPDAAPTPRPALEA